MLGAGSGSHSIGRDVPVIPGKGCSSRAPFSMDSWSFSMEFRPFSMEFRPSGNTNPKSGNLSQPGSGENQEYRLEHSREFPSHSRSLWIPAGNFSREIPELASDPWDFRGICCWKSSWPGSRGIWGFGKSRNSGAGRSGIPRASGSCTFQGKSAFPKAFPGKGKAPDLPSFQRIFSTFSHRKSRNLDGFSAFPFPWKKSWMCLGIKQKFPSGSQKFPSQIPPGLEFRRSRKTGAALECWDPILECSGSNPGMFGILLRFPRSKFQLWICQFPTLRSIRDGRIPAAGKLRECGKLLELFQEILAAPDFRRHRRIRSLDPDPRKALRDPEHPEGFRILGFLWDSEGFPGNNKIFLEIQRFSWESENFSGNLRIFLGFQGFSWK